MLFTLPPTIPDDAKNGKGSNSQIDNALVQRPGGPLTQLLGRTRTDRHCAFTGSAAAVSSRHTMKVNTRLLLRIKGRLDHKDTTYPPTSSVFSIFWKRFRSSSSRMLLRSRIFLGVTSIHSSCWIYSMHSSRVICFLGTIRTES